MNTYQADLGKIRVKRWKEVIGLREKMGMTFEEIGQRLSMSKAAAFSLYSYAKKQESEGKL